MTYNLLAIVESIFAGWILVVRFETSYGFLKRQRFFGFSLLDRITGALYKIKTEGDKDFSNCIWIEQASSIMYLFTFLGSLL